VVEGAVHEWVCAPREVLALVVALALVVTVLGRDDVQPQKGGNYRLHDVGLRHDVHLLLYVGPPLVSGHQCGAVHRFVAGLQPDELRKSFDGKPQQEESMVCGALCLTNEPAPDLMLAFLTRYPLPTLYVS